MVDTKFDEKLSEYFAKLGKKGGEVNKKKGPEYFRWVRSHVKKNKKAPGEVKGK